MNRKIENRNYGKWALISFFTIAILISAVVETLICRGGSEWLYLVLMRIPAIAAILYIRVKKQAMIKTTQMV